MCVKLLDDYLAVLSLGMLCETMHFFWTTGKHKSWTKDGITYECRSENHVPVVALTRHQSTPAIAADHSLPDWLQPFTEGSVEAAPAIESEGRNNSTQDAEPEVPALAQTPNASQSKHHLFTNFPKDPKCDVCRMTKTVRARFLKRLEMCTDGVVPPTKFGEVITADHKVLSEDNESKLERRYSVALDPELSYQEQGRRLHE